MLQLLLEQGQGYDDLAGLLGTDADEIRRRARAALGEMAGRDPDGEVALSDYLLGQADPIGRADAVRYLQGDPDANEMAARLVAQLRLLAPNAELPEIPPPRGRRRSRKEAAPPSPPATGPAPPPPSAAPPPGPAREPSPGQTASARASELLGRFGGSGRNAKLAVGGLVAVLLVLVVVVAIASGGGDGDGEPTCPTIDTSEATAAGLPAVELQPPSPAPEGECAPTGQAVLTATQDQAFLQINAASLPATAPGQSYIVWLFRSQREARPLARDTVGEDGNLSGPAPLATELLALFPAFQSVNISLVSQDEAQQVQQALRRQALTRYVGETVLSGAVPDLGAIGGQGAQQDGTQPGAGQGGAGQGGAGGTQQGGAQQGG